MTASVSAETLYGTLVAQGAQVSSQTVYAALTPVILSVTSQTLYAVLIGGASVTVAGGSQSQAATGPTLAAKSTVNANSSGQSQASTSPTLAAKSTVFPNDCTQGQSSPSPTILYRNRNIRAVRAVDSGERSTGTASPAHNRSSASRRASHSATSPRRR